MNRSSLIVGMVAGALFYFAASRVVGDAEKVFGADAPAPAAVDYQAGVQSHDAPIMYGGASTRTPVEQASVDPPACVGPLDPEQQLELDALVNANAKLRSKLAAAIVERDRYRFDESTPYGAFVASYEAELITDPNTLGRIQDWLRQFPVMLGPGEATWIAERTAAHDWGLYGRTSEVALIGFLDPVRLARDLPPARVMELRAEYADSPGVFP